VNLAVSIVLLLYLTSRMREELAGLDDGVKTISAEEKKNTERFLALTLPAKHNAGTRLLLILRNNF